MSKVGGVPFLRRLASAMAWRSAMAWLLGFVMAMALSSVSEERFGRRLMDAMASAVLIEASEMEPEQQIAVWLAVERSAERALAETLGR
jgi:hypothetical protein